MALSIIIPMLDVPLYKHVEMVNPAPQMMFIGNQYGSAEIQPEGYMSPAAPHSDGFQFSFKPIIAGVALIL